MLDRVHMTHAPDPQRAPDTAPPAAPTASGRPGATHRRARPGPRRACFRPGRAVGAGVAAATVWAMMTGPAHWADPSGWIIGAVAVAVVAALAGSAPVRPVAGDVPGDAAPTPRRLSLPGALRLSGWFALQALRGAVDVARRALSPSLPVAPGWYRYPLRLPRGAPRLVMANAITLLPGTLTAELVEEDGDDHLILHLLDARADPAPDLEALETRIRGMFSLPAPPPMPMTPPIFPPVQAPTLLALPHPKDKS